MGSHPYLQTPFPTRIVGSIVLAVLSCFSVVFTILPESYLQREVFWDSENNIKNLLETIWCLVRLHLSFLVFSKLKFLIIDQIHFTLTYNLISKFTTKHTFKN